MNSFFDYIKFKRKYIAIYASDETENLMKSILAKYNIKNDGDGFHITIIQSENRCFDNIPNGRHEFSGIAARPKELIYLGEDRDIPAIEMYVNEKLLYLRNFFTMRYILQDKWPSYVPHMSITYERITNIDEEIFKKLPEMLYFDKLVIDDVIDK